MTLAQSPVASDQWQNHSGSADDLFHKSIYLTEESEIADVSRLWQNVTQGNEI
ncbi:hypothetical protein DPMN_162237 [Dreissena polymorpha]|uniref:Uncharacterized protein n=1 Tax=Dreissena polymorpha TaxID=45954 RepID=A0A9D4ER90_DREPO|nr:hypothetical protein DPMN_162237 [Dreissena polymorpha]